MMERPRRSKQSRDRSRIREDADKAVTKTRLSSCFTKSEASKSQGATTSGGDLPPGFTKDSAKVTCYTCEKVGHYSICCPSLDRRQALKQVEKDSGSNYKVWRDPYWIYKDASGENRGPFSLMVLANLLNDCAISGWFEVTHVYVDMSPMYVGTLLDLADRGVLGPLIQVKVAATKTSSKASGSATLSYVQANLHAEVLRTTARWLRWILESTLDEKLNESFAIKQRRQTTASSSRTQAVPHSFVDTQGTIEAALEETRRSLLAAVVDASRRNILDVAVGQHLDSWLKEQELRKTESKGSLDPVEHILENILEQQDDKGIETQEIETEELVEPERVVERSKRKLTIVEGEEAAHRRKNKGKSLELEKPADRPKKKANTMEAGEVSDKAKSRRKVVEPEEVADGEEVAGIRKNKGKLVERREAAEGPRKKSKVIEAEEEVGDKPKKKSKSTDEDGTAECSGHAKSTKSKKRKDSCDATDYGEGNAPKSTKKQKMNAEQDFKHVEGDGKKIKQKLAKTQEEPECAKTAGEENERRGENMDDGATKSTRKQRAQKKAETGTESKSKAKRKSIDESKTITKHPKELKQGKSNKHHKAGSDDGNISAKQETTLDHDSAGKGEPSDCNAPVPKEDQQSRQQEVKHQQGGESDVINDVEKEGAAENMDDGATKSTRKQRAQKKAETGIESKSKGKRKSIDESKTITKHPKEVKQGKSTKHHKAGSDDGNISAKQETTLSAGKGAPSDCNAPVPKEDQQSRQQELKHQQGGESDVINDGEKEGAASDVKEVERLNGTTDPDVAAALGPEQTTSKGSELEEGVALQDPCTPMEHMSTVQKCSMDDKETSDDAARVKKSSPKKLAQDATPKKKVKKQLRKSLDSELKQPVEGEVESSNRSLKLIDMPRSDGCSRCYINGWQWREWSRSRKCVAMFPLRSRSQLQRSVTSSNKRSQVQAPRKNRADNRILGSHLKNRKKRLKLQRSNIHAWGLFALEPIKEKDFVIEYVGELVRLKVADLREQRYEKMGIDSSYLFRLSTEYAVDATKRGGLARFINHSCEPNCQPQIVTHCGKKKIFLYSKRAIGVGEELTYDYKFPLEVKKIPCFCRAKRCRGYMN